MREHSALVPHDLVPIKQKGPFLASEFASPGFEDRDGDPSETHVCVGGVFGNYIKTFRLELLAGFRLSGLHMYLQFYEGRSARFIAHYA